MRFTHYRLIILALMLLLMAAVVGPAAAGLIGGNFYVSGGGCRFPDVAYDSVDGKYLVVWPDYNYGPVRVFGRFVSNAGAVIGNVFQISDGTVYALYPTAAYNSTNNEFLITWDDGRGDRIAGQRVRGSDGALLGGNFTIGTTSGGRSSVAWSSTSNCYYVVYYLAAGSVDVYGQRVSNTGTLLGSELNISNDSYYSGYPSVGYGSSGNRFLVTWDYAPSGGYIRGQRIDASTGSAVGGAISVSSWGYEDRSSVAYDTVNNRFMVQFNEQGFGGYSYDQFGQLVNADGTLYGGPIAIAHTTAFEGETLLGCDVAYTGGAQRYLSIFQLDSNMGGQEVHPSGALPGGPATLSSGTGGHGGVAADTSLNRFCTAWESWEGGLYYVRAQVYEATADPAPGPVTNFVASSAGGQNNLTWTNPVESDYRETMIRYRTDTYPTSPSDGTLVVNKAGTAGANDSYLHSGLTNGVTYYYSAWAHDLTPNYALVSHTYGMPTAPVCYTDAFAYADGSLNGNGGWSGSAGSNIGIVSQTVKIIGGATAQDAVHTTSCGDPGVGYMTVTVKVQGGVGTDYMWDLWIDDTSNLNLARWYGAGTTARGRIGSTASVTATQTLTGGWDELKVKINPYANTTEFFFNGASLGVLDHGQTGAGDIIGRLRFTRGTSTAVNGNYLFFDNITIGNTQDTTPPASVTNFVATPSDQQANLSWTNPTDSDFTATMIRYRTDAYPTSSTDGTLVIDKANSPGSNDSYSHTSLTNGVTYYYSAFAHDVVPNYASGAQANTVPADVTPPGPVTGFVVTPGDTVNDLDWTNPGGDFTGVKVVWKTTGYPTGPNDGSVCYDGPLTSYYHTTLTNGVTYYYCAYAHDEVPNYSSAAQASGVPVGDITAPTFGGSIDPSVTTSLTPTVTITAQDTGTGLNVGSSEFAYSVDGGATYCAYIGRYTLHSVGTASGGGNQYWYPDFYHPASYTIAAGDHLQYDIYSNNTNGIGAVDLEGSFGNLRDSGKLDQNGLGAHPNTNLYSYDYHQWYHRDFDLSSWAGQSITAFEAAHETDSGVSEFYIRGAMITNNGQVKVKATDTTAWVSVSDTVGPGNAGYSSTVGPEMIASDPASPAACTGTNGTTAVQNVTATFSNKMMPLLVGSNNRIKYHISDMAGNMRISSVFTLTVNPTVTLNNSTFDADANGWTISTWRASTAYTYGVMAWDATSGNPGGDMRSTGSGTSNNTDRCTREGGEIKKAISTSGYSNIKITYDLKVNSLGTAKTGAGTGSCAVDHNLIDEQLTVYYSTNGGSSWTEAEYLLRSALLASYQNWGARTIDLTGVPACNNNPNFQVRFRWQFNQDTDVGYLDNIKVTSN